MSESIPAEEQDWNYAYHAVAFVDILGQKDAFNIPPEFYARKRVDG